MCATCSSPVAVRRADLVGADDRFVVAHVQTGVAEVGPSQQLPRRTRQCERPRVGDDLASPGSVDAERLVRDVVEIVQ